MITDCGRLRLEIPACGCTRSFTQPCTPADEDQLLAYAPRVRIASLLPAATEIVVALGLGDRLVAVTFECATAVRARCPVVVDTALPPDLAPAQIDAWVRDRTARGLPLYELDRAALAAAAPDLILTQDLCRVCALPSGHVEDALGYLGCRADVLSLDPHTLDEIGRAHV